MKISLIYIAFFITTIVPVAALSISEIMYDPAGSDTDREWVEIYNDSDSTIDMTGYKLFESNVNHSLTKGSGSLSVASKGYVVIVDNVQAFLIDNPNYTGTIIDSSFSLSNNGEYIAIKDSKGIVIDSLTFTPSLGGGDDGSTLSLIESSWQRGDKTPGAQNVGSILPPKEVIQTIAQSKVSNAQADLYILMPEQKIVVAGADATFTANAYSHEKRVGENGIYTWSFGDGGSKVGKSVMYHYYYPGEYVAILEVEADNMTATNRMKVKVIDAHIVIQNIGKDETGNFITLYNDSPYESDISGWQIGVDARYTQIPRNTIILPRKDLKISVFTLSIATSTIKENSIFQLMYPNHTQAYVYTASSTEATSTGSKSIFVSSEESKKSLQYKAQNRIALLPKKDENKNDKNDKRNDEKNNATSSILGTTDEKKKESWISRFLNKL